MRILYNFASRSRPDKFFKCLDNIRNLSTTNDWEVLAKFDTDDKTMNNPEVIERLQLDYPHVRFTIDESKSKVHAINRDINDFTTGWDRLNWDIIVNMSDDMEFKVKGFDQDIIDAFIYSSSDKVQRYNLDWFVHFPDGYVNERLSTMSIMGRTYYERFGYVYHPAYTSLWCDNEAQDVAMQLGCYKYVPKHIFTHKHPAWTGERADEQLIQTQRYYQADMRVYNERKSKNFDL
jgi:hypothetical protein